MSCSNSGEAAEREGDRHVPAYTWETTSDITAPESAVTAHPPHSPAPSPDNGPSRPAMRDRLPWWTAGAGIASLGTPVGIAVLHPVVGEIIAAIELVVALTIVSTALFGSPTLSDRAFRLLRWLGNQPEPPGPHRHLSSVTKPAPTLQPDQLGQ